MRLLSKKVAIILVIIISVVLNLIIFCYAYPQTFSAEFGTLARDFSAYYMGEWRLFHNPAEIYYQGSLSGDYQIYPAPQAFKYTPSFLLLFVPVLTLSYQNALNAFDIVQVGLIPVLAFFVYKLVKDKNLLVGSILSIIILVDPLPCLQVEAQTSSLLAFHWINLNVNSFLDVASFSPGYFIGYTVANAHILQTVFLVGAIYLGYSKKTWLSALLLAFGSFDPRAATLALPLIIWYNRRSLRKFTLGLASFLAALNLPFFFYGGVGFAFLKTEMNGFVVSQMYQYDWIPVYSIAALSVVELVNVMRTRKIWPLNFWHAGLSLHIRYNFCARC